ncbi:VanZ family protein [Alkalicoccus chagannorensis]|uniref:VanZ family protein n=1 Tax=Alkalicoccus chagannorensis TaxID=427072 RepID=UPI0006840845|nr:VanZ family protein [Alkalicoccus chagannorensis]
MLSRKNEDTGRIQWFGSAVEKWLLLLLFTVYMGVVSYIVFFAWNYGASYGPLAPGGRNYNLEPLLSIYNIMTYSVGWEHPLRILGGNILLFVPFGFFVPLLMERFRQQAGRFSFLLTILLASLWSTFIEVNQFLFTQRVANVDDVLLNTLGGAVGYGIYLFYRRRG